MRKKNKLYFSSGLRVVKTCALCSFMKDGVCTNEMNSYEDKLLEVSVAHLCDYFEGDEETIRKTCGDAPFVGDSPITKPIVTVEGYHWAVGSITGIARTINDVVNDVTNRLGQTRYEKTIFSESPALGIRDVTLSKVRPALPSFVIERATIAKYLFNEIKDKTIAGKKNLYRYCEKSDISDYMTRNADRIVQELGRTIALWMNDNLPTFYVLPNRRIMRIAMLMSLNEEVACGKHTK